MVSKHFLPYTGGLEVRVLELARWLAARNEEVLVLTSHERGTKPFEVIDGITVRRSRVRLDVFNALFTPGVFLNLMRCDYDIVDLNLPDPVNSLFVWLACLLRNKSYVVTYHADIIRQGLRYLPFKLFYSPIQWLTLRGAKSIFVTSPDYAQSSPTLASFMDKVVVAPSFIDPKKYNTSNDGSAIRKKHAIGKRKMVLFVGRLVPYKGVQYLIEACGGLRELALVIVGDGHLRAELETKAKTFDNIIFAGQVGDELLPQYYAACDVFVLPSVTRQEAFGLVLVEAMAAGKPVVSTNFSGMPYVVGDAGLLVQPENPKALREAIGRTVSNEAAADEFGGNGVKRVAKMFTKDVVCARILQEYYRLTSTI
jgi:glycosyltransferase involved in cell wall biosynthesis